MSTTMVKCGLGLVGALIVGCGAGSDGETGDDQNVTAGAASGGCREDAKTPCTPEVGSPLRKSIIELLRFSINNDLAKKGVAPKDADVKFVFKTLLIQNHHIWAAATIMRADGTTSFDLTGTKSAGKSNTVQALLEVESGSEFVHKIGIALDAKAFACEFVAHHFDEQAPQLYPGNMKSDCSGGSGAAPTAAQKAVDDRCNVTYSQGAGQCNQSSGNDDAAFTACLAPLKSTLKACCAKGGSAECAADAAEAKPDASQKAVDDRCAVAFSQSAGQCNQSSGNDDAAFTACLNPLEATLKSCCAAGGSPTCETDAR